MIVKGIVSAIDTEAKTIDVILPEYNDIVASEVKVYREDIISSLQINDLVLVVVFNNDFSDCLVL